jgi:WD40 repeat protein
VMQTLHPRLAFHPKNDLPAARAKTPAGRTVVGRDVPAAMLVDHAPLTFKHVSTNRPPTVVDLKAGRFAAVDDGGDVVRVYNLETGKETSRLEKVDRVVRLAFSADGSRLAVSSYDGFVRLFDPATGKRVAQWAPPRGGPTSPSPSPHYFLTFKEDGSELLTGFWHSGLKALDPATGKALRASDTYNRGAGYAYMPDGKSLLQARGDGLAVLNLDGKPRDRIGVAFSDRGTLSAVRVSPDGKHGCVTYLSNHIAVHDLATRDVVATEQVRVDGLEWYDNRAWTAAYSPDGEHLAVAHEKGVVTLWSAKTMRFVGAYKLHADHVRTVEFSKDGKRLATAGLDVRVRVWDVAKLLAAAE